MATLKQVETALRNAHKAGDVNAAKALAKEYKRLQALESGKGPQDWTTGDAASTAADVAKSVGSGLVEGAAATVLAPKTLGEMAGRGLTYGIDRLRGLSPEQASAKQAEVQQSMEANTYIPSPLQLIEKGYNLIRPYVSYDPKTRLGAYGKTTGEFASSAIAPGGLARKAAGVVLPAIGSETAGQMTRGSEYEPYARIAGGLVGGMAATAKQSPIKAAAAKAPTAENLGKDVKAAYKQLDDLNVVYDPNDFRGRVMSIEGEIARRNLDVRGKPVANLVSEMRKIPPDRMTVQYLAEKFADFGEVLADNTANASEKNIAKLARDRISSMMDTASLKAGTGVNTGVASTLHKKARDLARSKIRAEEAGRLIDAGEYYRSGDVSGLRNQFLTLGRNIKKSGDRSYTPIEQEAIRVAGKGTSGAKAAEIIGKFGFDFTPSAGSGSAIPGITVGGPAVAGIASGNIPLALAGLGISAAGTISKSISKYMTRSQVDAVEKVIRAGAAGRKAATAAEIANAQSALRSAIIKAQAAQQGNDNNKGLVVDVPLQPGLLGK